MSDLAWRPPTADDWQHRRVIVRRGERTCRKCGEVLANGDTFCWNCDNDDPALFVATTNYLRDEEFKME